MRGPGKDFADAIALNRTLEVLDLRGQNNYWEHYMENMMWELVDHITIQTLIVRDYTKYDPTGSWICDLLNQNRRIKVVNEEGEPYSHEIIEQLYSINRLFCGSEVLKGHPEQIRSALVGKTLV